MRSFLNQIKIPGDIRVGDTQGRGQSGFFRPPPGDDAGGIGVAQNLARDLSWQGFPGGGWVELPSLRVSLPGGFETGEPRIPQATVSRFDR